MTRPEELWISEPSKARESPLFRTQRLQIGEGAWTRERNLSPSMGLAGCVHRRSGNVFGGLLKLDVNSNDRAQPFTGDRDVCTVQRLQSLNERVLRRISDNMQPHVEATRLVEAREVLTYTLLVQKVEDSVQLRLVLHTSRRRQHRDTQYVDGQLVRLSTPLTSRVYRCKRSITMVS